MLGHRSRFVDRSTEPMSKRWAPVQLAFVIPAAEDEYRG
jgi:hypothetical protein